MFWEQSGVSREKELVYLLYDVNVCQKLVNSIQFYHLVDVVQRFSMSFLLSSLLFWPRIASVFWLLVRRGDAGVGAAM